MGIEYKFHVNSFDPRKLDDILRSGPFFSDYDHGYQLYNFRAASNIDPGIMPDLVAAIESDGLYICNNGGSDIVEQVINYLKASLESEFGQLTVEEL